MSPSNIFSNSLSQNDIRKVMNISVSMSTVSIQASHENNLVIKHIFMKYFRERCRPGSFYFNYYVKIDFV